MRSRVLVVDDEPSLRKVLQAQLGRAGYDVEAVSDGAEAIRRLEEMPCDLVVSDLKMPGIDGLELLAHTRRFFPGLPLIVITAHGTVDSAVEALRLGAADYITKPFDLTELQGAVEKALASERSRRRSLQDDDAWREGRGRYDLIGTTSALQRVHALVEKVADTPSTVLLSGESGTGKELVARALHAASSRRDGPFITVNCGAIPEKLFESELFGYEKGAFTGAVTSKPGRFEVADKGTILLDEVGELPREMQVKLLRVLQERQVQRVGALRPLAVDTRVIAATNVDLAAAVSAGRFREDLYYRLNVMPIRLPPLRERRDDIPLLVEHFIRRFNRRLGKEVHGVSTEAMSQLLDHSWPGNVRELENLVERGVLLADGPELSATDLDPGPARTDRDDRIAVEEGSVDLKEIVRVYAASVERRYIQRVLDQESGNVTRAARRLGISRKGLQLKMKEYGLREEDE